MRPTAAEPGYRRLAHGPRTSCRRLAHRLGYALARFFDTEVPTALIVGAAGLGLVLRWRAVAVMPLQPPHATPGLLLGLAEDVAVAAALALLASLGRLAAAAVAAAFAGFSLVHLAWCEALIYYGHPPRCADIEVAAQGVFVTRTFDPLGLAPAALILAVAVGSILASLRAPALRATRATVLGVGLGAALVAAGAEEVVPSPQFYRHPALVAASLWRCVAANPAAAAPAEPSPRLPVTSVRELVPTVPASSFPDGEHPLAYRAPPRSSAATVPSGLRPNVVFVLLEGVRAHEVGAWGGRLPGLTPNLDTLARSGIRFARAYSPGTHTATSEMGLWYGTLAVPDEILMRSRPTVPLSGLPERLRTAGWRSFLWMHNADQEIYKREQFYLPRGFGLVDERGFPSTDPVTNWGRSDRALMRLALDAFDRLDEPFAAMLLTVTNHLPFQVPADARSRYPIPDALRQDMLARYGRSGGRYSVAMLETIHYTDEAVGALVEGARGRSWFGRTLLVIAGDHGLPLAPLEGVAGAHELAELRHRVPLLMWAPWLTPGIAVDDPVSLADMPATILGLLGIGGLRSGPGVDALAAAPTDPLRPVIGWNDEARQLTIATRDWVYHATVGERPVDGEHPILDEQLVEDRSGSEAPDGPARAPALEQGRRWARVYLGVYPWLVTSGRSVVPPENTAP
ncbi:MAG: LTA synthase family protein [Thermoanaerobaculaceae bacterium]|nr:LTA synthase family protein [Thermoanaerobaculaceae bacterium]MDI9623022.1 LTA synthase family protein [Acidobacteriota bacterium]NLH12183.1 LTA synthase family protein [Holophagae bacterium]HPW55001.1 LTA synthase family protein [Thermoanaerobaculaceae bacterium]